MTNRKKSEAYSFLPVEIVHLKDFTFGRTDVRRGRLGYNKYRFIKTIISKITFSNHLKSFNNEYS